MMPAEYLEGGENEIHLLPVIVFKRKLPRKLVFSEKGVARVCNFPELLKMMKVFEGCCEQHEDFFAQGITKSWETRTISKERFKCEILHSKFFMIKATMGLYSNIYHNTINYKTDHYNSFLCKLEGHNTIRVNNFTQEKKISKLSAKMIESIEKHENGFIDSIEIVYIKGPNEEYYIERFEKLSFSISQKHRSINSIPVILDSIQLEPRASKISHSQSFIIKSKIPQIKPTTYNLKPTLQITRSKLESYLKTQQNLNSTDNFGTSFYCSGNYCNLDINVRTGTRKKILLRRYMSISHTCIRRALDLMQFPMSESTFDDTFEPFYKHLLKQSNKFKNSKHDMSLSKSYIDKDFIILCPTCLKIFNKTYLIEYVHRYIVEYFC